MENDITSRIEELMSTYSLSPSAFSDLIQIQRSAMSHILSRRNRPSLEVIQKILLKLPEINTDWLLTGKGIMKQLSLFEEETTPKAEVIQPYLEKEVAKPIEKIIIGEPIPKILVNNEKNTEAKPIVEFESLNTQHLIVNETEEQVMYARTPPRIKQEETHTPPQPSAPVVEKTIEKIVIFYSDKTFSVHKPE